MRPSISMKALAGVLFLFVFCHSPVAGQMRQIYLDPDSTNHINRLSFYSPNEGYVAFEHWIGYTTDSGRSYTKIYITPNNVNFNGYSSANWVVGFFINGVKAISKNILIVYGNYDLVPSILYSSDGGNTFTLVFWSQVAVHIDLPGITDVAFPQNDNIGYAIDADRVLKTTDGGLTWSVLLVSANSYLNHIETVDDNNLIVMSATATLSESLTNLVLKTSNGGSSWQTLTLPALQSPVLRYVYFLDANTGWLSLYDTNNNTYFFKTTNGGANWTQLNNSDATPFLCDKMRFLDVNTGYALVNYFAVYKTLNGGVTWEPLARDNQYFYDPFPGSDLQCLSASQLWLGGSHGFLEMSANGGGTPLPTAFFHIDTTGVYSTGTVNLVNFSRTGYSYQWYVNDVPAGTVYSATYSHAISSREDSITLIVTSGGISDTVKKYQYFFVPVLPKPVSFSPVGGGQGTYVTIAGSGFTNVTGVSFGGVQASSYRIVSDTVITAVVGNGASGNVTLTDIHGSWPLSGFTYYPAPAAAPPVISSVGPAAGPVGTAVTISGSGFGGSPSANLVLFGTIPATVQSASSSTIVCTVPAGASFGTVSVLNRSDGLTGQSPLRFSVTFADSSNFTPTSFTNAFSLTYNEYITPMSVLGKDLDGDGKPDLIADISNYIDSLVVFLNTSTAGKLSFGPQIDVGAITSWAGGNFETGDVDGDGLPDIVCTSNSTFLTIYKNSSTTGHLSFSAPVTVPVADGSQGSVVTDLDNDGRNDIAVASYNQGYLSVIRNTGVPGLLSFAATQYFLTGGNAKSVAAGDLDGDGKKDLVTYNDQTSTTTSSVISCFRNTSSPGFISFASRITLSVAGYGLQSGFVSIVDYDGDGKPDLLVANDSYYYIFRNTSTPGNISFAAPAISVSLPPFSQGVSVSNYSGTGRPDIFSGIWSNRNYLLLRNLSHPGVVANDSLLNVGDLFSSNPSIYFSNGADFDGDGKPDIAWAGSNDHSLGIYRNMIGTALPFKVCTGGPYASKVTSDMSGSGYQWQQDKGTGFVAITDNDSLSGSTTNTLQFINPSLSWNGYRYRCLVNGHYSSIYQAQVIATVSPGVVATVSDSNICYRNPAFFNATDAKGNTSNGFTWQVNGAYAGYGPSFYANDLKDSDQVRVLESYYDACARGQLDSSQPIRMHVRTPRVNVTVSDSVICAGQAVTFTATPIGVDSIVTFQWYVSTSGYQNDTGRIFTTSLLDSVSQVQLTMNVSAMCPYPNYVSVDGPAVIVADTAAPSVVVHSGTDTICAGSMVVFTAVASDAGTSPDYQWLIDGIGAATDSAILSISSLRDASRVQCIVTGNSFCRNGAKAGSNVVSMKVRPVPLPSVFISPSDTSICAGTLVVFTAGSGNGGSDPIYRWALNGVSVGNNSPTYTAGGLVNGDVVTVSLTSNAVCASPDTVTSPPSIVAVLPRPGVTISGDTVGDPAATDHLVSIVVNGGVNPVYLWQDSTSAYSWQTIGGAAGGTVNYSPMVGGDYVRCIVTGSDGCTAASNTLSLTVITIPNTVRYYPNPAGPTLYVENMDPMDPIETITVFTAAGNRVISLGNLTSQVKIAIDVASLNPGIYYVSLTRQSGKTDRFQFMKR